MEEDISEVPDGYVLPETVQATVSDVVNKQLVIANYVPAQDVEQGGWKGFNLGESLKNFFSSFAGKATTIGVAATAAVIGIVVLARRRK